MTGAGGARAGARRVAVRDGDRQRGQQQREHGGRVVGEPEVAPPPLPRGHPRDEECPRPQPEGRVRALERGEAAVPERRARAEDPRARTDQGGVPAAGAEAGLKGAVDGHRLPLPTEGRARGDVVGQ